jgi:hypothetical protein
LEGGAEGVFEGMGTGASMVWLVWLLDWSENAVACRRILDVVELEDEASAGGGSCCVEAPCISFAVTSGGSWPAVLVCRGVGEGTAFGNWTWALVTFFALLTGGATTGLDASSVISAGFGLDGALSDDRAAATGTGSVAAEADVSGTAGPADLVAAAVDFLFVGSFTCTGSTSASTMLFFVFVFAATVVD